MVCGVVYKFSMRCHSGLRAISSHWVNTIGSLSFQPRNGKFHIECFNIHSHEMCYAAHEIVCRFIFHLFSLHFVCVCAVVCSLALSLSLHASLFECVYVCRVYIFGICLDHFAIWRSKMAYEMKREMAPTPWNDQDGNNSKHLLDITQNTIVYKNLTVDEGERERECVCERVSRFRESDIWFERCTNSGKLGRKRDREIERAKKAELIFKLQIAAFRLLFDVG